MIHGDPSGPHRSSPTPSAATGPAAGRVEPEVSPANAVRWAIRTQFASLHVFNGVPERDIDRVAAITSRKWVPGGYRILITREDDDVSYLVLRGVIKVVEDTDAGEEVILAILGAGDVIEGLGRHAHAARSVSLVAIESSVLAIFPRRALDDCLRTMPVLACNLLGMMSLRLRAADDRIQALATTHVEARLARVLLDLGRRFGSRDGRGIRIPFRLTQAEMGAMVGASRVRINHTLGYLRKSGAISIETAHMVIRDEQRLIDAASNPEPSDRGRSKPVY